MIQKEYIDYYDQDTLLEGFAAYPSQEKCPLVILCHAWRGRDDFILEKAERVAKLGFASFAIDMYGKGILGSSKEENAKLKKPFVDDRAYLQKRLLSGYKAALSLPYVDKTHIAVVGFGFGGMCALDLARSGVQVNGLVSIYGHFDAPKNVVTKPIEAKILILHGYKDPVVKIAEVHAFAEELDKAKVEWQAHVYGNCYHAFATPSANDKDAGIFYNAEAAKDSWEQVERFLLKTLLPQ